MISFSVYQVCGDAIVSDSSADGVFLVNYPAGNYWCTSFIAPKEIYNVRCDGKYVHKQQGGIQRIYRYTLDASLNIPTYKEIYYQADNQPVDSGYNYDWSKIALKGIFGETSWAKSYCWNGTVISKNKDGNQLNETAIREVGYIKGHKYAIYLKSASLISLGTDGVIKVGLGANGETLDYSTDSAALTGEQLFAGVTVTKIATTTTISRLWIYMSGGTEGVNVEVKMVDLTYADLAMKNSYSLPMKGSTDITLPKRTPKCSFRYIGFGLDYKVTVDDNVLYSQGMAIYGNYMFRLYQCGYCQLYDITDYYDIKFVAGFKLGSYSVNPENHANTCQFAPTIREGQQFPLLYVGTKGHTYVEQIRYDEEHDSWSSECIQDIIFGSEAVETVNNAAVRQDGKDNVNNTSLYGGIIGDDGFLYTVTVDDINDVLHLCVFNTPPLTESSYIIGNENQDDFVKHGIMLDYVYSESVNQGSSVYNNQWFTYYGTLESKSQIIVFDLAQSLSDAIMPIKAVINLNSLYGEPEDGDVQNNNLIITYNNFKAIVELKFNT